MNNTACVLVAVGETKIQAWASVAAAVVNLVATIWLVQRIGVLGVILGTVASYIVVLIVPQTLQLVRVLKHKGIVQQSEQFHSVPDSVHSAPQAAKGKR